MNQGKKETKYVPTPTKQITLGRKKNKSRRKMEKERENSLWGPAETSSNRFPRRQGQEHVEYFTMFFLTAICFSSFPFILLSVQIVTC